MDRGVVLLVSGASATLQVPFILHSFACIFLHIPFICMPYSFHFALISCHVPFICIHFPSFSFHSFHSCHFHSNVHSCPFIFRSLHFPFILHSCPFISFLELWNGSMAWPGDRVQQMVIAKLSLRILLNNPSNI